MMYSNNIKQLKINYKGKKLGFHHLTLQSLDHSFTVCTPTTKLQCYEERKKKPELCIFCYTLCIVFKYPKRSKEQCPQPTLEDCF